MDKIVSRVLSTTPKIAMCVLGIGGSIYLEINQLKLFQQVTLHILIYLVMYRKQK